MLLRVRKVLKKIWFKIIIINIRGPMKDPLVINEQIQYVSELNLDKKDS